MGGGGGCQPPAPSLCLISEPDGRSDLKNFFMDKYPISCVYFAKERSSHSREILEKPAGGGIHPPGHRRVNLPTKHLEV